MQNIFLTASDQVAQNVTGLALGNGFQLPDNDTRSIWSDKIRAHVQEPPNLNADQDTSITEFFDSLLQVERIRNEFVRQLKRVVKNPRMYGVNRDWKETQREAIEAIIQDISTWITRPLIQVPTGVGKSMIWAGIMRAYYDTLRVFGLENHFEIILLTSRINIADQMIARKIGTDKVSDEYQEDEAIDFGDVTMWFKDFTEDQIRVLAGNSQNKKEIEKKATITIMCFPALTTKNMSRFFRKKTGLVVVDESHRLSNRVRIVCENFFHTAFFIGGSATTKGAKRNNPFKFFEAVKPQKNKDGGIVPYEERLTYWTPISLCIERKELKKVRYINAVTSFDLSSLPKTSHGFSEKKAGQLVSENTSVMKAILESLFLDEYPILDMVGSKKPIERKWLVFVKLISIAEELAEYCNETLVPKIRKKYGKNVQFKADSVSGKLSRDSFSSRMQAYKEGTTTIMFNAAKLGEGADVPTINGIISFNPYSRHAQWKLNQEIGRGTRFVENDDLLFIDGVFNSTVHDLASGLTLFGIHNYFPGGLVAGLQGEREVETKVINLLQEGLSYKQVWQKLLKKERKLVPYLRGLTFQLKRERSGKALLSKSTVCEEDIQGIGFVENQQVKDGLDKSRLLGMSREKAIELGKEKLRGHKIHSYFSLLSYSPKEFTTLNFGIFGKGKSFMSFFVPTRPDVAYFTEKNKKDLALVFGWTFQQEVMKLKKNFKKYGITSYVTLVRYKPRKFKEIDFQEYGGVRATLSFFLSQYGNRVSKETFKRLAPVLGWTYEQAVEEAKVFLEKKCGISDQKSFEKYGITKFRTLDFKNFGKVCEFRNFFIPNRSGYVTLEDYQVIISKLYGN